MASTYSTNLKLELMGTGDQSGTWGDTTNTNMGTLLEQAIVGYASQGLAGAGPTALTIPNGATGTGRYYVLEFTGASVTAGHNVTVPAVQKPYIVVNSTNTNIIFKVSGQTGVTIQSGKKAIVYNNGVDVIEVANAPVTEAGTQTLTNKTLTTPFINTSLTVPAKTGSNQVGDNLTIVAGNGTGTGGSGYLAFQTASPGSTGSVANTLTERMRITPSGNVGIGTSTPTNQLTIYNNDAGATGNPLTLELYRDSASPANSDLLGRILFSGENSVGSKVEYGSIYGQIENATTGLGFIKISPALTGVEQTSAGFEFHNYGGFINAPTGPYLGLGSVAGGSGAGGIEIYTNAGSTAGTASYFSFQKSRGVSGTETAVLASDVIGVTYYFGHNGTAYAIAGGINVRAAENWTGTANGSEMRFFTTGNGATGNTERMRIAGNGFVGIGTGTPLDRLQIAGNTVLENDSAIYWNAYWDGTQSRAVAAGWTQQIYSSSSNGAMAFYTSSASATAGGVTGQTERMRIDVYGFYQRQPAPTSKAAAATLTAAEVGTRILQYTGAAATVTMPTGTSMDTEFNLVNNLAFDFAVINTGSGTCTLAVNTGVTAVGLLTTAANTSSLFRIRRSAANTYIMYRVA